MKGIYILIQPRNVNLYWVHIIGSCLLLYVGLILLVILAN